MTTCRHFILALVKTSLYDIEGHKDLSTDIMGESCVLFIFPWGRDEKGVQSLMQDKNAVICIKSMYLIVSISLPLLVFSISLQNLVGSIIFGISSYSMVCGGPLTVMGR